MKWKGNIREWSWESKTGTALELNLEVRWHVWGWLSQGPEYAEKTIFPFPFILNGIWSWGQFCFRFWTKWNSIWLKIEREQFFFRFWTKLNCIWLKIERETVTTIISHSLWKDMEIQFSQRMFVRLFVLLILTDAFFLRGVSIELFIWQEQNSNIYLTTGKYWKLENSNALFH